jgi:hypothetical protein
LYSRKRQQVGALSLVIKQQRAPGHAAAGLNVTARLKLTVEPRQTSQHLKSIESAPSAAANPAELLLVHQSTAGGYRILCDRRWHVMRDDTESAVLRFVNRGELVAQCNIAALPRVKAEQPTTLAEFQRDVERSLGEHFKRFDRVAETGNEHEGKTLRVTASGIVSELPIEWHYYLRIDPQGRRVALTFTLEQSLAERFEAADETLVESLTWIESTASKSVEKK